MILPLKKNSDVIYALILHDIKGRFFGNGLGYVLTMAWPFVHFGALLITFTYGGRVSPFGSSAALYSFVSIVPFIAFIYVARFIMMGPTLNRSFLQYPVVRVVDIIIARCILEVISIFIVCTTMISILSIFGIDCMPERPVVAAEAFCASVFLGIGFGILNAVIAMAFPIWITGFALLTIIVWATSGVFVVPSALPEIIRYLISFNPVVHGVEWMRGAYYQDYNSIVVDKQYMLSFSIISLFLGLSSERVFRSKLLSPK